MVLFSVRSILIFWLLLEPFCCKLLFGLAVIDAIENCAHGLNCLVRTEARNLERLCLYAAVAATAAFYLARNKDILFAQPNIFETYTGYNGRQWL